MRALAPPLRTSARLVAAGAALLTLAAGTAAVAAPAGSAGSAGTAGTTAAAVKKLTWHPFALASGWQSASTKTLVTGSPAWAFRNGIVYFRGAITHPVSGSSTFGNLPKYARPAHNLYIQVYTSSQMAGTLFVGHNGVLEAFNGNATAFTSLAAVSYPTAAVTSHKLTLKNAWASSQPSYDTGDPSYAVSGGVVYLSGSLHRNSGSAPAATVLPKAARPAHLLYISVYTFDGSTGTLRIRPTGEVDVLGADALRYTSLASVSFPAAGAKWHNFSLVDGWKSGLKKFHTATPAYTIINGIVYLNGSMFDAGGKIGLWTDLPAGVRTAADVLEIEVGTANGTAGSIGITNSLGLAGSMPFTNAQQFTSLAGVAYPQTS